MKPHEERVVTEKTELDAKLEKLTTFIESATFKDVPYGERFLLKRQKDVMQQYSEVLKDRIDTFTA